MDYPPPKRNYRFNIRVEKPAKRIISSSPPRIIYITTLHPFPSPMFSRRNVNPSLISHPSFLPSSIPSHSKHLGNSAGIGRAFSFYLRAVSRKTALFRDCGVHLTIYPIFRKAMQHREWDFGHPPRRHVG